MATYNEIYNLSESSIINRVTVAVLKIADYILTVEGIGVFNHANRLTWSKQALQSPHSKAREMLWAVLSNGDVQSQGNSVSDATIQYIVETKLDLFCTGV